MIFQGAYIQQGPHSAVLDALKVLMNAVTPQERMDAMYALGDVAVQHPQREQPLQHRFTEGLYAREILNPKGSLIITKTHKEHNFSFVLKGRLISFTEEGQKEIVAPCWFTTKPGTKRVLYAVEDTIFVTVHPNPTNTNDLEFLEDRLSTCERIEA